MQCDGMTLDNAPCELPAQTTRDEVYYHAGKRITQTYNFCTACAHDFDESKYEVDFEADQANERYS